VVAIVFWVVVTVLLLECSGCFGVLLECYGCF